MMDSFISSRHGFVEGILCRIHRHRVLFKVRITPTYSKQLVARRFSKNSSGIELKSSGYKESVT
jgi:hypothetical protein